MKNTMNMPTYILMLLSLFTLITPATAAEPITQSISLSSGNGMSVHISPAYAEAKISTSNQHVILWFYSEAGKQKIDQQLASELAKLGHEVWLVDLFESYFLPVAASSIEQIPEADIKELFVIASQQSQKSVIAVSSGRSAIPLLRASQLWHKDKTTALANDNQLSGLILISPKFFVKTPEPGVEAEYMPIVKNSNELLFIIQPEKSPWYWKLKQSIASLEIAGSDVYFKIMTDVRDRFYFRPDADNFEQQTTIQFSGILDDAISAISQHPNKLRQVSTQEITKPTINTQKSARSLSPFKGSAKAPGLDLQLLDGKPVNLENYRGRVLLVNFWASWCPPCVHEMPSMQRLQNQFDKNSFIILGVNMAEDKSTIKEFLQTKVDINFPILLDTDGAALQRWSVFAFPTSYLIDKQGNIRYSVFGSYEWDEKEPVSIIKQLLNEK